MGRDNLHFIYAVEPPGVPRQRSTPFAITHELVKRLRNHYEVKVYDWAGRGQIQPGPRDILIGHPHPEPGRIFERSFRVPGWKKRIVFCPFHHGTMLDQMKYMDDLVSAADHFLAICGPYWTDTIENTITSHWAYKIKQLDLAVNRDHFPFVKNDFNPPGARRFLYIGHTEAYKGTDYLSQIADAFPDLTIGWIGSGQMQSDRILAHGRMDFAKAESLDLVRSYDFLLTCGRSDANPTTILEAAAWGLIPVCTPQSGYSRTSWITNIPLDDLPRAGATLRELNQKVDSTLKEWQSSAQRDLASHYSWDRFADEVIACLEAPIPTPPQEVSWSSRAVENHRAFQKLHEQRFLREEGVLERDVMTALQRGQTAHAIKGTQRFLDQWPHSLKAYRLLSKGLFQAKLYAESARVLETALAREPSFLEAYVDLALLLQYVGRVDAARIYLNRAEKLNPTDPYLMRATERILGAGSTSE